MTSRPQSRPGHHTGSSNKPRFVNPDPLPSIDEFRLDHILNKVVPQESASVSSALSRVSGNYQQDLKGEIRKALAIEQKIQNKNIHAIKRAHRLTKQWLSVRKRLAKNSQKQGENGKKGKLSKSTGAKTGSGPVNDIDNLLSSSIEVSSSVKNLALRMSDLSRKRGGSGLPDSGRFPLLNKLLVSLNVENGRNDAKSAESGSSEGDLKGHVMYGGLPNTASATQKDEISGSHSSARPPENAKNGTRVESSSQLLLREIAATYSVHPSVEDHESREETHRKPDSHDILQSSRAGHEDQNSDMSEEDTVMDAATFEQFMSANIAKYRERKDERFRDTNPETSTSTKSTGRCPRNPLRLLSSGSLSSTQSMKSSPFLEESDPFKYSFLPRKSTATVLETPQLSLHKKLRIKVLPSPKSPVNAECGCQTGQNSSVQDENAQNGPDDSQSAELWSSSEAFTETDNESDQLLGTSSSSDSSDSLGEHVSATNSYYLAFEHSMKSKRKKRRRIRKPAFQSESSPTPKHQPSHRVLQPKQSILKLKKERPLRNGNVVAKSPKFESDPEPSSKDGSDRKPHLESLLYTASPRASFVNSYSVSGTILQGPTTGPVEFEFPDVESVSPCVETSDLKGDTDGSRALGKLKRLVIGSV